MLEIEVPVIQAAIGGISCPELAAAVSEAGGMGAIAMTGWGYDGTRGRLERARQLTGRGFVGNLLLSYDVEAELRALLEAPPKVVSFFWGDVAPYVEQFHDAGSLVMANVGSVEEAQRAAGAGADIIVAQGWEAGGHVRGQIATMALVPAVVDAIAPVPVVAAGGIADGRGLAAALCLGAEAAWIGTRFLSAEEADIHPDYRARVLEARATDTASGVIYHGGWEDAPGRDLRNKTVAKWEVAGRPASSPKPAEEDVIAHSDEGAPIHRYDATTARSGTTGNVAEMSLWAGQGVGLVRKKDPAAAIVRSLIEEAQAVLDRAGR